MRKILHRRCQGISLLVPTQNAEKTVEMCIRSFSGFPDEMIVVDNGSTDSTKEIVRELEKEYDHVTFYDAPHLKDLYENRQYAFERSHFEWIMRIDSDYVAYTEGEYDIAKLREKLLATRRRLSVRPTAFNIFQVNLQDRIDMTGPTEEERSEDVKSFVVTPTWRLRARIVRYYPFMKFMRLGRWEGLRFLRHFHSEDLDVPYWFHCNFKQPADYFRRHQRQNWRECGDFEAYPTLDHYIEKHVLPGQYPGQDYDTVVQEFYANEIQRHLVPYDPRKYYPYPSMLKERFNLTDEQ